MTEHGRNVDLLELALADSQRPNRWTRWLTGDFIRLAQLDAELRRCRLTQLHEIRRLRDLLEDSDDDAAIKLDEQARAVDRAAALGGPAHKG